MINICVPVLRRYDLLRLLALSLKKSTLAPRKLCVIDNGQNPEVLRIALNETIDRKVTILDVYEPHEPMGVAASWNWFICNVREERIIANDDVIFAPDSLEKLIEPKEADLIWAEGCGFSCFVMRDTCVQKLGLFDEMISPGYGYYEDEDYLQRLDGRGTKSPAAVAVNVNCGVVHERSATLKVGSRTDIEEHHRRFLIAQANYAKKWHLEEAFPSTRDVITHDVIGREVIQGAK